MVLLASVVNVGFLTLASSSAGASPPAELSFISPPQAVTAGQTVTLHWGTVPSGDFVIFAMTSAAPSDFDFSSPSQVVWPNPPGGTWNSTYDFWASTAPSVNIVIPSGSTPATKFTFSLTTCNLSTGCSSADDVTLGVVDMAHPGTSSMTAFAGTTVSLHWTAAGHGDFYLLTNPSSTYALNFSSSSVVMWPSPPGGSWSATYGWWSSTAGNVSIAIPPGAPAGASFTFNLYTCNLTSGLCSNSSGGPGVASITITVAGSEWSQTPYTSAFSQVDTMTQTGGGPTSLTFSPGDTLWSTSEFGAHFGGGGPYPAVYNTYSSSDPSSTTLNGVTNDFDSYFKPFAECFGKSPNPPCAQANYSALAESSTYADGRVWWTEGGWGFYGSGQNPSGDSNPDNLSEIVSADPTSSDPSSTLCWYLPPAATPSLGTGDDEVIGVTSTGSGINTRIWFVAQDPIGGHPYVGSFEPSQVGSSCPSAYDLTSSTPSYTQVPLTGVGWPNQIAGDPNGTVWVDSTWPSTQNGVPNNYIYNLSTTSIIASYAYNSTNSYSFYPYGLAYPWDIVTDANYVYAIDFGDGNLVQIEKSGPDPGQVNVVPIPYTTDTTSGFGLALQGNSLYFTAGINFGDIDIGTWEAASQGCAANVNCAPAPTSAVEYTGLESAVDPTYTGGFNAIAASADGQVGISDYNKTIVRLIPPS